MDTLPRRDRPAPARRARRRRVPRRARADDHGRRAAGDRHRPRRLDPAARGVVDHQRLPAGLRRDDAAGGPARRPVGQPAAVPVGPRRCSPSARCWRVSRPSLELLVAARLVQAVGGGILVPVATSAATHLFAGASRPRALGVIGALTFLGMAAGPFLGAAILGSFHPEAALSRLGIPPTSPLTDILVPGLALGVLRQRPDRDPRDRHRLGREQRLGDAAAGGTGRPRRGGPVLAVPARHARLADAARRAPGPGRHGPRPGRRVRDPRDGRGRRAGRDDRARLPGAATRSSTRGCSGSASFSSATLVSGLTGYGFATAIVGGGGVRRPGALRRPGRAAARARGARRGDGRGRAPVRASPCGCCGCGS